MITRNGQDLYECSGIDEARYLINVISEHPLELNSYNYIDKIVGMKIWWRSEPAIVRSWVGNGQACVMLEPDGIERFSTPAEHAGDEIMDDGERDVKADIFDKHIWWFRS